VLIANHNYAQYVREAIDSALDQSYGNLEVVVCDDGSTDRSVDVIKATYGEDERVRLITQENSGQAAALTAAARASRGQIMCLLDADDVYLPHKVREVVDAFARSEAGLVMHPVSVVDEDGKVLQELPLFARLRGGDLRDEVLRRGGRWVTAPTSALSISATWRDSLFPLPPELVGGADGFIFGLMPLLAPVEVIDEPLVRYRIHGSNALGTRRPDLSTTNKMMFRLETTVRTINARLESLNDDARLELERNLYWLQQRANVALLGPSARSDARVATRRFVQALKADDLWPGTVKRGLTVLYGAAPWIPRGLRARWLNIALGLSPLKAFLRRMMRG